MITESRIEEIRKRWDDVDARTLYGAIALADMQDLFSLCRSQQERIKILNRKLSRSVEDRMSHKEARKKYYEKEMTHNVSGNNARILTNTYQQTKALSVLCAVVAIVNCCARVRRAA